MRHYDYLNLTCQLEKQWLNKISLLLSVILLSSLYCVNNCEIRKVVVASPFENFNYLMLRYLKPDQAEMEPIKVNVFAILGSFGTGWI